MSNLAALSLDSVYFSGPSESHHFKLELQAEGNLMNGAVSFELAPEDIAFPADLLFARYYPAGESLNVSLTFDLYLTDTEKVLAGSTSLDITFSEEGNDTINLSVEFSYTSPDGNTQPGILALNLSPQPDIPFPCFRIAELDCLCKFLQEYSSLPDELKDSLSQYYQTLLGKVNAIRDIFASTLNNYPGWNPVLTDGPCAEVDWIRQLMRAICDSDGALSNIEAGLKKEIGMQILGLLNYFKNDILPLLSEDFCDSEGGGELKTFGEHSGNLIQSSSLYLQAAGGEFGADGIASGIHLRWALMRDLGKYHLPKGDYSKSGPYASTAGFSNNPDDFVYIYKTTYDNLVPITINFSTVQKSIHAYTDYIEWVLQTSRHQTWLRFTDVAEYTRAQNLVNPVTSTQQFIDEYAGIMELGNTGNLTMFAGTFEVVNHMGLTNASDVLFQYESISYSDPTEESKPIISSRDEVTVAQIQSGNLVNHKIYCEGIKYFRFRKLGGTITAIKLETYKDFIYSHNWVQVNKFALTLDDAVAENRLETGSYNINKNWPRYNDNVRTNLNNYVDKWKGNNSENLKTAVEQYLLLSKSATNLTAKARVSTGTDPKITISYLDMLKLVSLDFHAARMLGLGHIDQQNILNNQKYVYLAVYRAPDILEANAAYNYLDHFFMCLPTATSDYRQPLKPTLGNFSHEVPNTDNCSTDKIVDEQGYVKYGNARFINLNREPYVYELEKQIESFFESPARKFCMGNTTKPVFYGVEYHDSTQTQFISPELTNHPSQKLLPDQDLYKDYESPTASTASVSESLLFPEKQNPLFTHVENEAGQHFYAMYAVNWFSRTSQTSDESDITTTFVDRGLKAPLDLAVQYIQTEDPLVFTSAIEQAALAARMASQPAADNFWTRVTFNWNHIQKHAYQTADKVQFFFRDTLPMEVAGKIQQVVDLEGTPFALVHTTSYFLNTKSPKVTISPAISTANKSKFINSYLVCPAGRFRIEDVTQTGSNPVIKVEKIQEQAILHLSENSEAPSQYEMACNYILPLAAEYFTVAENLNADNAWTHLAAHDLQLKDFSNYTETVTEDDGTTTVYKWGGIYEETDITSMGGGLYEIAFTNFKLTRNVDNQANAEFYRGTVRVPVSTNTARKKVLDVWRIEEYDPNFLLIYAYDSDQQNSGTDTVAVGLQYVNFHPGYRVYLPPSPTHGFQKSTIMPSGNAHSKKTMLTVRAADSTKSLYSDYSTPAPLLALRRDPPLPPDPPVGSLYSTRPDIYGKASYTLDIEVEKAGHMPFSHSVYRGDEDSVMNAIYEKSTINDIREAIAALSSNTHRNNRLWDLVNVVWDTTTGNTEKFKEYDGYRMPFPDKAGLFESGDNTHAKRTQKIKEAINKSFVPVNQQPAIYQFVREGKQTENLLPQVRDKNGEMFKGGDFHPFPNCRKFTNNNKRYFRFTDYSLDGSSQNLYFYFAREISRELIISDRSAIIGPITIVNSYPPEAPEIKEVSAQPGSFYLNQNAHVRFVINQYLRSENIERLQIYRTSEAASAYSTRSMVLAKTLDVGDYSEAFADDFSDLDFPPIGDLVHYRLVALRKINNEFGETEYVPSHPSKISSIKPFSNTNPPTPQVSLHSLGSGSSATVLNDVRLQWNKVVHKGIYRLYQLTPKGGWKKIYEVQSNDALIVSPANTIGNLALTDANGDLIYYIFKVDVESPCGLFNNETFEFNLTDSLLPKPVISGPRIVCRTYDAVFSTPVNAGSTYTWITTGSNATVVSGANTDTVTLRWANNQPTGIKEIKVAENNGLFTREVAYRVTVKPFPVPDIVITPGSASVCVNQNITLSTANTGNSFTWDVGDGVIVSGSATHEVVVNWPTTGTKTVTVSESNGGCSTPDSVQVLVIAMPTPAIAGPSIVCENSIATFSTLFNPGSTYAWNLDGAVLVNSAPPGSVDVYWNSQGAKTISVTESNGLCFETTSFQVTVIQAPNPVIIGPVTICSGQTHAFTCQNGDPANQFIWNPAGGTVVSQSGVDADIFWPVPGTYMVTVNEDNGSCVVPSQPFAVTVVNAPSPVIVGPVNPSVFNVVQYTVAMPAVGNTFMWNVSAGGTILSGQGTPVIDVQWSIAGQVEQVDVVESNGSCSVPAPPHGVIPV